MFMGHNAYQISNTVNNDSELMSKFGKCTPAGVHYHVLAIRREMENNISEDALDTYIAEFMRARIGFDMDVSEIDELIKLAGEDIELVLKLRRHRHEIKIDSFKMLQDSALPLQVKKLKKERERYRPKKDIIKEVEDNRPSEERDIPDNK